MTDATPDGAPRRAAAGSPLTVLTLDGLRRRHSAKWRGHDRDVLPMSVAEMDTPLAGPIVRTLTEAVTRGDTGYAVAGRLPEAFAGFAAARYGWRPDPADMRLVPDVMSGLVEVLQAVTEPGARIVVNTPAYPPFLHRIPGIGRPVVENPLVPGPVGYRIDPERLEHDFAAGAGAYVLCNPHNPTGTAFGRDELATVAALADRYGVRVVTDEIHAPLTHQGTRHVPFASLDGDAAARSLTLVSASKAWNLAGLKAALVVGGPAARAGIAALRPEADGDAGILGVLAAHTAFTEGSAWLDGLLPHLTAARNLLGAALAEHLPQIVHHPPRATYLAWLDCRALGLGDDPAARFLEHGRVALVPGSAFGAAGRGFVRFNFAAAPERIVDAVERMASTVAAARR